MPHATPTLALGAVFELHPHVVRVIAFDSDLVMYDGWTPLKDGNKPVLRKRFTWYRVSRAYFEAHARYLRTDPLTAQELCLYRPELPFSLVQYSDLSWYPTWDETTTVVLQDRTTPVLHASSIFIEPFGPRDTLKPAVLIEADNGGWFSGAELLIKAYAIQAPWLGDMQLTEGVGLHRDGVLKGLPSFYIWGAKNRGDAPVRVPVHNARLRAPQ